MNYLCIDYGTKKTGFAVTDPLGIMVLGLETFYNEGSDRKLLFRIEEIVKERKIDTIVLGMPYNQNGSESERTIESKKFYHKLKCKFNSLNVEYYDERFTTIEAENLMEEIQLKRSKRKKVVDIFAAINILESYLRFKNNLKDTKDSKDKNEKE